MQQDTRREAETGWTPLRNSIRPKDPDRGIGEDFLTVLRKKKNEREKGIAKRRNERRGTSLPVLHMSGPAPALVSQGCNVGGDEGPSWISLDWRSCDRESAFRDEQGVLLAV